jgi:hypothetical protein
MDTATVELAGSPLMDGIVKVGSAAAVSPCPTPQDARSH